MKEMTDTDTSNNKIIYLLVKTNSTLANMIRYISRYEIYVQYINIYHNNSNKELYIYIYIYTNIYTNIYNKNGSKSQSYQWQL